MCAFLSRHVCDELPRAHPGQNRYENAIMGLELLDACRVAKVAKTVVAGMEGSESARVPASTARTMRR
jgi:hypothetical protein